MNSNKQALVILQPLSPPETKDGDDTFTEECKALNILKKKQQELELKLRILLHIEEQTID